MASSDSQMDKLQRGWSKTTGLPDVNINTGAQSIGSERASLRGKVCQVYFGQTVYMCTTREVLGRYGWVYDTLTAKLCLLQRAETRRYIKRISLCLHLNGANVESGSDFEKLKFAKSSFLFTDDAKSFFHLMQNFITLRCKPIKKQSR